MNKERYKSPLGRYIVKFLEKRDELGIKIETDSNHLSTFDRFLRENKFTENDMFDYVWYNKWLKSIEYQKASTRSHKICTVRLFLHYLISLGIPAFIPPKSKTRCEREFKYIFSKEEINRLFVAAQSLRVRVCRRNTIIMIMPALIELLYSTGARISEALSIKNKDIYWDKKLIVLKGTKNGDDRVLALKDSLAEVLKQYISYRDKGCPNAISEDSPLFVSSVGKECRRKSVASVFEKILRSAEIPKDNRYTGPSVHSIRYSACIHAFLQLAELGIDLYAALPIVSAFMGHKKISDTEYYLRLTLELYPDLLSKASAVATSITGTIRKAGINMDIE